MPSSDTSKSRFSILAGSKTGSPRSGEPSRMACLTFVSTKFMMASSRADLSPGASRVRSLVSEEKPTSSVNSTHFAVVPVCIEIVLYLRRAVSHRLLTVEAWVQWQCKPCGGQSGRIPLDFDSHQSSWRASTVKPFGILAPYTSVLPHSYYYYLSSWNTVLLERPIVTQLVKKFPTFYGTPRFITVFTRVCLWPVSWATPLHPVFLRSILILPYQLPFTFYNQNIVWVSHIYPMRVTCPAYLVHLYLITRVIFTLIRERLNALIEKDNRNKTGINWSHCKNIN